MSFYTMTLPALTHLNQSSTARQSRVFNPNLAEVSTYSGSGARIGGSCYSIGPDVVRQYPGFIRLTAERLSSLPLDAAIREFIDRKHPNCGSNMGCFILEEQIELLAHMLNLVNNQEAANPINPAQLTQVAQCILSHYIHQAFDSR